MSQEQKHRNALQMKHRFVRTLCDKNEGMDPRDVNILADALVLKVFSLSSFPEVSVHSVYNWISTLYHENMVRAVSKSYKDLASGIRQHCLDYPWCYADLRSFKRSRVCALKVHDLLGPFTPVLADFLSEKTSPISMELLLTICEYESRIPIGSDDLHQAAKEEYITFDRNMEYSVSTELIHEMRDVIVPLVQGFQWDFPEGHHGPGSTSEVSKDKSHGTKECYLTNDSRSMQFARRFDQSTVDAPVRGHHLVSRWVSVTKNVLSRRSIAAEPTVNQYHQQAVFSVFSRFLGTIGVTLHDQTPNQRLAQEGSFSRNFSTIDLSSASDSVHRQLVWDLLKGTKLFLPLFLSRTTEVDVEGTLVRLNKFCSMGSACCFPLECLVFYTIVQVAYKRVGCTRSKWAVYGDDIVVCDEAYYEVCSLLQQCGFHINPNKTFPPWHPYKESCGGEYFYGFDVRPFRLPRKFSGWSGPSPDVSSLIDLVNEFRDRGFSDARKLIVRQLLVSHRKEVIFSPFRVPGIGCIYTTRFPATNEVQGWVPWQQDIILVNHGAAVFSAIDRVSDLRAWLRDATYSLRTTVAFPEDQIGNVRPIVTRRLVETRVPASPYVLDCDMG